MASQQTSTGLARWQAALGAATTGREAARRLAELAGVEVSSETLRTHAERVGTEWAGEQRAATASVEQTHEPPAGEHDPAPGMLVARAWGPAGVLTTLVNAGWVWSMTYPVPNERARRAARGVA